MFCHFDTPSVIVAIVRTINRNGFVEAKALLQLYKSVLAVVHFKAAMQQLAQCIHFCLEVLHFNLLVIFHHCNVGLMWRSA